MTATSNVNQLMISEELFRLVISSTARVSLLNRKFETINSLVRTFLQRQEPLCDPLIKEIGEMPTLGGDIRLFLRLKDVGERPNVVRTQLSEALGRHCTMREVVAYACLEWSQLPPLTIGRG
jgi:hypothetical protein